MVTTIIKAAIFIAVNVGVADTVLKRVRFDREMKVRREKYGKGDVPFVQALLYERLQAEVFRSLRRSLEIIVLGMLGIVLLTPDWREAFSRWLPVPPDWMRTRDFMYLGGAVALILFVCALVWIVILQVKYKLYLQYFEEAGTTYYSDPDNDFDLGQEGIQVYQVDPNHIFLDMMIWENMAEKASRLDLLEGLDETEQYRLSVYLLRQKEKTIINTMSWAITPIIAVVGYGQLYEFLSI